MTTLQQDSQGPASDKKVVYLLGAGATQACISYSGSTKKLIMSTLLTPIMELVRDSLPPEQQNIGVTRLLNEVLTGDFDVEHLLTFLDDSPSQAYRDFAVVLRNSFAKVLRDGLLEAQAESSAKHSELYAALIDMHEVNGIGEQLKGFLTLNYDVFLEHAIVERHQRYIDYGIGMDGEGPPSREAIPVLKLHGSFGWTRSWPVATIDINSDGSLWIPPGIRKPKSDYPFNLIWGRARDLLDCDILRIIGVNLGSNDWDLISLLFTTKHLHNTSRPYEIEIISPLQTARTIATRFPYLDVKSIIEIPVVGDEILREALTMTRSDFDNLSEQALGEAESSISARVTNPFAYWLRQKGESLLREAGSTSTGSGIFQDFMDSET